MKAAHWNNLDSLIMILSNKYGIPSVYFKYNFKLEAKGRNDSSYMCICPG